MRVSLIPIHREKQSVKYVKEIADHGGFFTNNWMTVYKNCKVKIVVAGIMKCLPGKSHFTTSKEGRHI